MTSVAVIGSGWRAECYLRVLSKVRDRYKVSGVVSRTAEKREYISRKWGLPVFKSIDELLLHNTVDFIIISVSKSNAHNVITQTSHLNIPLLAETPPAATIEDLITLNRNVNKGARIQIAEQYFLTPLNQARLKIINSGILGDITHTQISISHGYHGVSLIRKALGVGYKCGKITSYSTNLKITAGPTRQGNPKEESLRDVDHTIAIIDFDGKSALYDFERDQHRSWFRTSRFIVRGTRGEIFNDKISYIKGFNEPVYLNFNRINTGENENLEGFYLKGITAGENWLFKNSFKIGMSDDDLAMLEVIENMKTYIETGDEFYSLSQASQDQYIALLIEKASQEKRIVEIEPQCWTSK